MRPPTSATFPTLEGLVARKNARKVCRECLNLCEAKGLCQSHYRKWRRSLGLDPKQTPEYAKEYSRSSAGRWVDLKRASRLNGGGFDITREQHEHLVTLPCEYCGGPLNPTGHCLDRKDSSVGYLIDNVVPCCYPCNKIKNNLLTYEEMKAAMAAVLAIRKAPRQNIV